MLLKTKLKEMFRLQRGPAAYIREDNSRAVKDKANAYPCGGLVFCIIPFCGFVCSFALRGNLSVAIVAMVNHTAVNEDVYTTNDTNSSGTAQCPRDPALRHADGQFIWDRHQQTAVLAAYYYDTIITEVGPYVTTRNNKQQQQQRNLGHSDRWPTLSRTRNLGPIRSPGPPQCWS